LRGLAGSSAAKIQTFFHPASILTKIFYLGPKNFQRHAFPFLPVLFCGSGSGVEGADEGRMITHYVKTQRNLSFFWGFRWVLTGKILKHKKSKI
jgi:hypothetical protein